MSKSRDFLCKKICYLPYTVIDNFVSMCDNNTVRLSADLMCKKIYAQRNNYRKEDAYEQGYDYRCR